MSITTQEIRASMEPLLREAERKGLWLYCGYQNLWFSPQELRKAQDNGEFLWGVRNWKLRDPAEYIELSRLEAESAQTELERIEARVRGTA